MVAFEGTDNTHGETNVSHFFDMYTGRLKKLWEGVGTGAEGTLGSVFGLGTTSHVEEAYEWVRSKIINGTDRKIDIIGFSRGAAAARVFANMLVDQGLLKECNATIRFIGVWDTVASVGFFRTDGDLKMDLPSVAKGKAFHAMSIHEDRSDFKLTRYKGAKEVWFAGAHSDVGGGYKKGESGLSNAALRWMVHHASKKDVPVSFSESRARRHITVRSRTASNVVMHDQIESSLLMRGSQTRLSRVVNPGDEVHLSAGIIHYDPSKSSLGPDQGEAGYVEILRRNIRHDHFLATINEDDGLGWITLPSKL